MNIVPIPNYTLYGESEPWDTPGSIHFELINERSSLHNWFIKPHRHDQLHQIVFMVKGSCSATIGDKKSNLTAPALISLPALTVHGFEWAIGTEGYVLTVFKPDVTTIFSSIPEIAQRFDTPLIVDYGRISSDSNLLPELLKIFHSEYKKKKSGRLVALKSILSLILIEISRSSKPSRPLGKNQLFDYDEKCSELIEFIEAHYTEHNGLNFYAEKMHITTAKMNRITRSVLNMTPNELIARKLVLEAKQSLLYTTLSANQISELLGFKDPAYFSRFFKSKTGETTCQYRKRSHILTK